MANSESSLAIMQADIDTALQEKRQANAQTASDTSSAVKPEFCHASMVNSGTIKSSKRLSNTAYKVDNTEVDMTMLDASEISRVIEMAWEDRTPFAAIEHSYGLNEAAVIIVMRQQLKPSSFRLWRQRVSGRATKHQAKRPFIVGRAYCATQYKPR
jgi:uncharacterized protein (TIGR03643 family)